MTDVAIFPFNPFQENTYILYDDSKECAVFDPGCYSNEEKKMLSDFIEAKGLKPVRLINTHCHIDHVLGNKYIFDTYGLKPELHEEELVVLQSAERIGQMYGIPMEPSPEPETFLPSEGLLEFGNTKLQILFTPGHSPASLSFYSSEHQFVIGGDVLFRDSIGRTDLPGGSFETLIESIRKQFFTLGDEVKVYPGHGPATTIGYEKKNNPFLQ